MEYDVTKQNYEVAHDWHAKKSASHSWAREINAFLELKKGMSKVLDVGCGDGRDIIEFRKREITADGLDYSKPAIESLKKQFPDGKFYEADMLSSGLPESSYEGIWACASILNLKKADAPVALAEFKRLLVPGGALFVSVKEGEGERMVPDVAGERFFTFYSEEELKRLVENASFTIDHAEALSGTRFPGNSVEPPPRWLCIYATRI